MQNYSWLPSKKFQARFAILAGIAIIALFIQNWGTIFGHSKNNNGNITTFGSVLQKDSNYNGIPDYEEVLWGLDPKGNGEKNKNIIEASKKTLTANGDGIKNGDTETEKVASDITALIASLSDSGDLNAENSKTIGETIGQNIKEKSRLAPQYTLANIKKVSSNNTNYKNYANSLQKLINDYANKVNEMPLIQAVLDNKSPVEPSKFTSIKKSYYGLADKIINLPVPEDFIQNNLDLANNIYAIGSSMDNIQLIQSDSVLGAIGVDQYKSASQKSSDIYTQIINNLSDRGII